MSLLSRRRAQRVTFCIPAFNAEGFLLDTLRSVERQTHEDFRALVSVDLSDDATARIVRQHLPDRRFRPFVHRRRLGWAGNLNFLMRKVRSRYFCVLPHDDLLEPSYAARMLEALEGRVGAVAAHSDIRCFGNLERVLSQESIVGDRLSRALGYLERHYAAVLLRAVVDRGRSGPAPIFESNSYSDFSEDAVWGLRLALRGEVLRVPEALYSKRFHDGAYHRRWHRWNDEEALDAWLHHCVACFEVVREAGLFREWPAEIVRACLDRFHQSRADLWRAERLRELAARPESRARFVAAMVTSR